MGKIVEIELRAYYFLGKRSRCGHFGKDLLLVIARDE
jgi:hypothetical protein